MKTAAFLATSFGAFAAATTAGAVTFTYEYTGHPLEVTNVEDAEMVGALGLVARRKPFSRSAFAA